MNIGSTSQHFTNVYVCSAFICAKQNSDCMPQINAARLDVDWSIELTLSSKTGLPVNMLPCISEGTHSLITVHRHLMQYDYQCFADGSSLKTITEQSRCCCFHCC